MTRVAANSLLRGSWIMMPKSMSDLSDHIML